MNYLHYTIDELWLPLYFDTVIQCNYTALGNIRFHSLSPEDVPFNDYIVAVWKIKLKPAAITHSLLTANLNYN